MESQYVIVETIHEKEYRIAILSVRYVSDITMYMCLADRYYVGMIKDELGKCEGTRENRFKSFADAEKAVEELMDAIIIKNPVGE